MNRIAVAVVALVLTSPAIAGPCDVAGAIPNCDAIVSGRMPMPAYHDSSVLKYGRPSDASPVYEGTIFEFTPPKIDTRSAEELRLHNDTERERYTGRTIGRRIDQNLDDQERLLGTRK